MNRSLLLVKRFVLWALLCICLVACKRSHTKVIRGIYYWKAGDYRFHESENKYLRELSVQKMYVKLFEVQRDPVLGNIPVAKSRMNIYNSDSLNGTQIIPVVFIRNDIFAATSSAGVDSLADNIVYLTNRYFANIVQYWQPEDTAGLHCREIQIDCDWTAGSRDKYFQLLKTLKKLSGKDVSCTLRLYPFKYRKKMGVPPVDRVSLMCYNLISPLKNRDKNSILDVDELRSYLKDTKKYPLHMDIDLPVYSWMLYYHNNQFRGIIYENFDEVSPVLNVGKPFWYDITRDTTVGEFYLRAGGQIKHEQTSPETINKSIDLIKQYVDFDRETTISLFHLDNNQLKQYHHETLDRFYTAFSH